MPCTGPMEAGVDDVAIGALFGLYDWKFDVMGLVHHAWDLENCFGIGPAYRVIPAYATGSQFILE